MHSWRGLTVRQRESVKLGNFPANATRPELVVVRANVGGIRPTIIGRSDFFVRYGEKEREAVASFDFLNELSGSTSASNDDDLV